MPKLIRNFNTLRFAAAALALALLVSSQAAFAPSKAKACPFFYGEEYITRYYWDPAFTEPAGLCSGNTCTGEGYCTGDQTPYTVRTATQVTCC